MASEPNDAIPGKLGSIDGTLGLIAMIAIVLTISLWIVAGSLQSIAKSLRVLRERPIYIEVRGGR